MTDSLTKESRSALMARIRSKNTVPEITVRRLLFADKYRFRIHRADLPGTPDIVFPGRRKAIFVHGCFWHSHSCKMGRVPKSRVDYWQPKLLGNAARDARNENALRVLGWEVLVVWQCEMKDLEALRQRLRGFLDGHSDGDEIV
ncbi:MAG TPA: DNA mismatch endonuclease Vsr [Capsulimonadaceae bacterium]|jgi:DNA mismatch endonuclease (patch repair protein)